MNSTLKDTIIAEDKTMKEYEQKIEMEVSRRVHEYLDKHTKKTVCTDTLFRNTETGKLYTAEYLKHNDYIRESGKFKIENRPYFELKGETVRCNYSQIFPIDRNVILCNDIVNVPDFWDGIENGELEDEDGNYYDVFQYFIIDSQTAEDLKEHTDELVFYVESLDLYILGVMHYGTSWDYVDAEFTY